MSKRIAILEKLGGRAQVENIAAALARLSARLRAGQSKSRNTVLVDARRQLDKARREDFRPIAEQIQEAIDSDDLSLPLHLRGLKLFLAEHLPSGNTAGVRAWNRILTAALMRGVDQASTSTLANAEPVRFEEAIQTASDREIAPTSLSSAEIQALSSDIKRGAVFSARTTDARYVQAIKDRVEKMLKPKTVAGQASDLASMRAELQRILDELGYTPEDGFRGNGGTIPPAERGSLQDLSSETRIDLVLETQVRMMTGAGFRIAGQEPLRLHEYPAWELVRFYDRVVPRGTEGSHTIGWTQRWQDCDGIVQEDGRMIALKDDPIWDKLGDPARFDDGLGNPYPPFAFNSGYSVREIPREETLSLEVMNPGTEVKPLPVDVQEHFEEDVKNLDDDILAKLERELEEELGLKPGESVDADNKIRLDRELAKRKASYG